MFWGFQLTLSSGPFCRLAAGQGDEEAEAPPEGEKDAKLAQKLGQLQPFIPAPTHKVDLLSTLVLTCTRTGINYAPVLVQQ